MARDETVKSTQMERKFEKSGFEAGLQGLFPLLRFCALFYNYIKISAKPKARKSP